MNKRIIREDLFSLSTAKTMMVFSRRESIWRLVYFGGKVRSEADALELGNSFELYSGCRGKSLQETYPAFGSTRGYSRSNVNTKGAVCATHADGDTATEWKVVRTEVTDDAKEGTSHLVITLKDLLHDFTAKQHIVAVKASDVFETWAEIRNGEDGDVRLSRMCSAAFELLSLGEEFRVRYTYGQWGNEGQLGETKLARGQAVTLGANSGIHDAWDNSPSFMLACGDASETAGNVIGGALAWSGAWSIELFRGACEEIDISAGAANLSGPYVLASGKSITLPKFVITHSSSGYGEVSRRMHKWARTRQMPNRDKVRDVLLNSWEGSYFDFDEKTLTDMMDGVRELGGEMFVIDDGWFGRGKYARNDDRRGLGDWCWNFEKLPRGLNYLVKEARKRGLKLGLWFEPEMANTESELVRKHPEWVMRQDGRALRCGRGGTQVVLDMSNPELRDAIFRQMCEVIDSAKGLSYIKWDANAEFMNPGSAFLGAGRQANIWFDYVVGMYEFAERLARRYPKIVVQACASGGGRAELGMLGHADEFWGSDNTDARQRIFIQWGEQQFCPASAMACHVTAVPSHQTGRCTPLKYRFDVAMSGRLGFELHPKNMSADEIRFAKNAVAEYKGIRKVVQHGDLFRLVSPYSHDHASIMYADESKETAVVFVWGLNRRIAGDFPAPIVPVGLDPGRRYAVREINVIDNRRHCEISGKTVGGDALVSSGFHVRLGTEYDSAVLVFTAVE